MNRRNFIKSAFGSLTAVATLPMTSCFTKKHPNILMIAVDDLRPQLGCYCQNHVISPNIDKLASEGFLAERAYCNVPVCGASRASLMTGARPKRDRFVTYYTWAEKDYPNCMTLQKFFKNKGYIAISNGKVYHHKEDYANHWSEEPWLAPTKYNNWRDYVLKENNTKIKPGTDGRSSAYEIADVPDNAYRDGKIADKTISDLKRLKNSGKPFFLAAGFVKPHLPFNAPKKYWDLYNPDELPMANNNFPPENVPDSAMHNWGELRAYHSIPKNGPVTRDMAKRLVHGYHACVSYVDAQIGRILITLKRLGLDKNTIVLLWGDHGWNLEEHTLWCKHCNFDNALRVPLIVKVPGKKSIRSSELVEFIDIYPTLAELAGFEIPEHCDGKSFTNLISQPNAKGKEAVFCRWHNGKSVKTDQYLYTEWKNDDGQFYARMLYDHLNDPEENYNIAELPENQELVKKLSVLLYSVE